MARGSVSFNISVAQQQLKAVENTLKQAQQQIDPTFVQAATEIIQAEVYGGAQSLAGMASQAAPVDTGALADGLQGPYNSEAFPKKRRSQSVFSVTPAGKGKVAAVMVTYGTDPQQGSSSGGEHPYVGYVKQDFLGAAMRAFQSRLGLIGNALSQAVAYEVTQAIRVAAQGAAGYSAGKLKLSAKSIAALAAKFGASPVGTSSGRGFKARKLASLSSSHYKKIMRQRRYKLRKAGLA
jgi:hypothetical protein